MAQDKAAARAISEFVEKLVPTAQVLNAPCGGSVSFKLPKADVKLSVLISALEASKQATGIDEWALSNVSLEEVFLKIAMVDDGGAAKGEYCLEQRAEPTEAQPSLFGKKAGA